MSAQRGVGATQVAQTADSTPWTGSLGRVSAVWLATRVFTIAVAAIFAAEAGKSVIKTWQQWDAGWFVYIARHGYSAERDAPAFYPLYPFALRVVNGTFGDRIALAGFVLSLALTFCAFVLLNALAQRYVDDMSALRGVLYLALFPYAFYLQAYYSESMFLVCAIGACLAAEDERFFAAGALTGAGMLTRPFGPTLLVAVGVLAWRSSSPGSNLARLAIAPLEFLLFPLVLRLEGRSPVAFLHAEHKWRTVTPLSAFYGLGRGARQALTGFRESLPFTSGNPSLAVITTGAFVALVVFVALSVLAWRRLGAPYGLYCFLSLAVPVAATTSPWPLESMQRFVLTLFPCFIVLGALPIGAWMHRMLLTLSAVAMIGVLYYWARGAFVA